MGATFVCIIKSLADTLMHSSLYSFKDSIQRWPLNMHMSHVGCLPQHCYLPRQPIRRHSKTDSAEISLIISYADSSQSPNGCYWFNPSDFTVHWENIHFIFRLKPRDSHGITLLLLYIVTFWKKSTELLRLLTSSSTEESFIASQNFSNYEEWWNTCFSCTFLGKYTIRHTTDIASWMSFIRLEDRTSILNLSSVKISCDKLYDINQRIQHLHSRTIKEWNVPCSIQTLLTYPFLTEHPWLNCPCGYPLGYP